MKVELKQIIDQLSEAIGLEKGFKVAALIDKESDIVGWGIAKVYEDGKIELTPNLQFGTIKQLIDAYKSE